MLKVGGSNPGDIIYFRDFRIFDFSNLIYVLGQEQATSIFGWCHIYTRDDVYMTNGQEKHGKTGLQNGQMEGLCTGSFPYFRDEKQNSSMKWTDGCPLQ